MDRRIRRPKGVTDEHAFFMRVWHDLETGCLEVMSAQDGDYGQFWIVGQRRSEMAHRWSYEFSGKEIGKDLDLDHLCRNRSCVNPEHLEPVTRCENVLRGEGITAQHARRTECLRGHVLIEKYGRRVCPVCRNAKQAV